MGKKFTVKLKKDGEGVIPRPFTFKFPKEDIKKKIEKNFEHINSIVIAKDKNIYIRITEENYCDAQACSYFELQHLIELIQDMLLYGDEILIDWWGDPCCDGPVEYFEHFDRYIMEEVYETLKKYKDGKKYMRRAYKKAKELWEGYFLH